LQFAHIVSHDLQTPLRTIAGFAEFLREEYTGKLDETADDYIMRIVRAVGRMQRMINDLLDYSRIDSADAPFGPVDLGHELGETLTLMRATLEQHRAVVTHDPLPVVHGDRTQIARLLQNLIGNAVKYHGDESPRVHVSAERSGDRWTVRVRDNGVGIPEDRRERVFELFRRLDAKPGCPGTGVGLSICRRIVQRHGGRIWVEPREGPGATFTLPVGHAGGLPEPPSRL